MKNFDMVDYTALFLLSIYPLAIIFHFLAS